VVQINQQHQMQPTEPIQYSIQSLLLVVVKVPMPIVKLAVQAVVVVVGQIQLALAALEHQVKVMLAAPRHHLLTPCLLVAVVPELLVVVALILEPQAVLAFNQVLQELPHIMAAVVAEQLISLTVLLVQVASGAVVVELEALVVQHK
jgi:hypothetical protein